MTSLAFLRFGHEQELIERGRDRADVEAFYLREILPEKLDIELRLRARVVAARRSADPRPHLRRV